MRQSASVFASIFRLANKKGVEHTTSAVDMGVSPRRIVRRGSRYVRVVPVGGYVGGSLASPYSMLVPFRGTSSCWSGRV